MYQLVRHSNQFLNLGTTQRDRDKYALKPDYFEIDEFNVSQFIDFVSDYSKNMAYIDAENRMVGDWSSFFRRNSTMCLLRLMSLKTKGLKLRFVTNQSDTLEASIQSDKSRINENLVEDIINLFAAVEDCVINLKQYSEFQKEIQNIIQGNLSKPLDMAINYVRKNNPDNKIDYLLNFGSYWLGNEAESIEVPNSSSSFQQSIIVALNSVYFIKKSAEKYYHETVLKSKLIEPSVALLLTFHKLYGYASDRLNEITSRHLNYYYKDVLRFKNNTSVPNEVFIDVTLKEGKRSCEIKKGLKLIAGVNNEGENILYEVLDGLVANEAKIDCITAIEMDEKSNSDKILNSSEDDHEVYLLSEYDSLEVSKNGYGFGFSAQYINLEEGHRKLSFHCSFTNNSSSPLRKVLEEIGELTPENLPNINAQLKSLFIVRYTGEDDWVSIDSGDVETSFKLEENGSLSEEVTITVFIDEVSPSISNFKTFEDEEINMPPEFEFYINPAFKKFIFPFGICQITKITVGIELLNVKNLLVSSDFGEIDPSAPFQPFGPTPILGSSFYVGHRYLFNYPLLDLKLNLEWFGLPLIDGGFSEHYECYDEIEGNSSFKVKISALSDKEWLPYENKQVVDLFQTVPNTEELETISLFRRINEIGIDDLGLDKNKIRKEPNMGYSVSSMNGFLKLELCYPFNAFGHEDYPNLIRDYSIRNIKKKENKYPNEPYTPTLKEISCELSSKMEFNSENSADYKLKHIYPFGSEFISMNTSFLPAIKEGSTLILGLSKMNDSNSVSLFFKFNESIIDDRLKVNFSGYDGKKWKLISEEDIISDSTEMFHRDGIIKLNKIERLYNEGGVFSDDLTWFKFDTNGFSFLDVLTDVRLNAFKARCMHQDFLPKENIDSFTVTAFESEQDGIDELNQKFPSFGGVKREPLDSFNIRVSERLKHKGRAVNVEDIEKLILNYFPEVYRCVCFPYRNWNEKVSPGDILIIIVPALNRIKNNTSNALFSSNELMEVQSFLSMRCPLNVNINVKNPNYEKVRVKMNIRFRNGYDHKYHIKKLDKDIKSFISPFLYMNETNLDMSESIQSTRILNFIENLDYIEHILNFSLFHIVENKIINQNTAKLNSTEISPSKLTSILVSDDHHDITIYEDDDITDKSGINEMMIGTDYIVEDAENNINYGLNHFEIEKNYHVFEDSLDDVKEKTNFTMYLNL